MPRIGRFLGILALFCAAVAVMWLCYAFIQHRYALRNEQVQNSAAVALAQQAIESEFRNVRGDTLMLSESAEVHAFLGHPDAENRARVERMLKHLAQVRGVYSQLRVLSPGGDELVRINVDDAGIHIIEGVQLQEKSQRYYVKAAQQLSPGRLYQSPLDLNVEHGRIQRPWVPTVRVAAPVFDAQDQRQGMVIINLDGSRLFDVLRRDSRLASGAIWLVDRKGHWLIGPHPSDDWSYILHPDKPSGMPEMYPEAWRHVLEHPEAQVTGAFGLLTFANVDMSGAARGGSPTTLRLISLLPKGATSWIPSKRFWPLYVLLLGLLVLISWWITHQQEQLAVERRRIQANSRLLDDIFRHSSLMMKIKDLKGTILRINEAGAHMIGRDRSRIEGHALHEVATPETIELINEHDAEAIRSHRVVQYEEQVAYLGGSYTLLTTRFPVTGEHGDVIGVGAVSADISERVRSEEMLRLAMKEAKAASAAKSAFLANMSHELRTPLNSIIGLSELLMEDLQDAGQTQFTEPLRRVILAGRHLLQLINDVLDMSRIESGYMELNQENCRVREMVDVVVASMQTLVEANANKLQVEIAPDANWVYADPLRLRQVLMNLLGNAAKFTHSGEVRLRVTRIDQESGQWIRFAVSDTGIGMAPEIMNAIFEPFAQGERTTTRRFGGSGLGLAITRQLVHLMGGEVRVESVPGEGSTFTVSLASGVPGTTSGNSLSIGQSPVHSGDLVSATDDAAADPDQVPTVLIVEDDLDAAGLLLAAIKRKGIRVVMARTGTEALATAREIVPALMLLDIQLGDMSGWDLLAAMRRDSALPRMPVVLCTVSERDKRMLSLGVAEHLSKPVDRSHLRALVQRIIPVEGVGVIAVVDDDEDYRKVLAEILRRDGHVVFEGSNGGEALDIVRHRPCDLLLLDMFMPGMNGLDVVEALHADPALSALQIVLITAADIPSDVQEQVREHALTLVLKHSESPGAISARVREMLARLRRPPRPGEP